MGNRPETSAKGAAQISLGACAALWASMVRKSFPELTLGASLSVLRARCKFNFSILVKEFRNPGAAHPICYFS